MAGHSQFKNIMHRKGAQDAKRAKMFTKLIREIITAAKSGLPDPAMNPRLRGAIQAARKENMPKDKIDNAVKRGSGAGDTENYEEIRYEGYGPGGVAIIVEALTDNRNRTAAEVRSNFTKLGGNLGETGSVGFMFEHLGQIVYPQSKASEEAVFEAAIEAGADNCETEGGFYSITCPVDRLHAVREALEAKLGEPESAKLIWSAKTTAPVGEEQATSLLKLIDALEDNDDVQSVYTNMDIDETLLQKLSA